jgi:hypothetical protein
MGSQTCAPVREEVSGRGLKKKARLHGRAVAPRADAYVAPHPRGMLSLLVLGRCGGRCNNLPLAALS